MLAAGTDEVADLGLQRREVGGRLPPQRRQPITVPAQVVGDTRQSPDPALVGGWADLPCAALERGRRARSCRERALDQPGDSHHVPLQSLGGVHGEHLDGIGGHLDVPLVQATLLRLSGIEPGQEATQRGPVGGAGEARRHVREGVQVGTRGRWRVFRTGQHLDVQTQSPLGLAGEISKGHTGERAQAPDRLAQPIQTLKRHRRDARAAGAAPVG